MSVFVCYPKSALATALALLICHGCGQTGALYLPQPELPQAELPQSESPQANTGPAETRNKTEADKPRTSRP